MIVVAVVGAAALLVGWCCMDHGDDGVEVDPLQRLHYRRGTARRIDPGVRLAERHD